MGSSNLSGCCTFTKYLFIFFNILFFLIGAAALGVGIWAQVSEAFTDQVNKLLAETFKLDTDAIERVIDPETVNNAAILIIVGGAVVMLIGFLGCFGGMKENQCLLVTFFVSLFIILGVLVAGAILIIAFPQTLEGNFKDELTDLWKTWAADHNANETITFLQEKLECCGVNGATDYTNNGTAVPDSCKNPATGAVYGKGCLQAFKDKIQEWLSSHPWILGGVSIGVVALIVIGMVLSCCLFCAVRKGEDAY